MKNEYIEKFLEVKKDLKNRDKKKKKIKHTLHYLL